MSPWLLLEAMSVAGALGNTTSWFSFVPVWAVLGLFWPYWASSFVCFVAWWLLLSFGHIGPRVFRLFETLLFGHCGPVLVGFVFVVLCVLNAIEAFRHCWPSGLSNEGVRPGYKLVLCFGLDFARLAISSMLLRF